jgi:hypothetical protein
MGGFQAVASGLGETGEQLGTGLNNALNEALKVQLQQHNIGMDQAHLALAQAQQKQTYDLATQQHDLMRQQMLESGWTHTGTVKDPDGTYYQQFDNPRMPAGQQTRRIPYGGGNGGVPPDSMEAMLDNYKRLKEQGFEDTRAQQLAFKSVNLYRTDPAGLVGEYAKYAKELNEEKGVSKVPVFGFGTIDISNEAGQAKYAQAMIDSGRGMGPLLRSMMGFGGAAGSRDMTGWTANEQREYRAVEEEAKRREDILTKMGTAQMSNTFNPEEQKAVTKSVMDQIDDLWKGPHEKYDEINNRHGRGAGDMVPVTAPDGTPGRVPKARLAEALSKGYNLAAPAVPSPTPTGAPSGESFP